MSGGPNFKTRSDLESTDERLHNDMKQNAEYVCFRSFYPKGNLNILFVLKLELPPRGRECWTCFSCAPKRLVGNSGWPEAGKCSFKGSFPTNRSFLEH
jgi:hypothetical protein